MKFCRVGAISEANDDDTFGRPLAVSDHLLSPEFLEAAKTPALGEELDDKQSMADNASIAENDNDDAVCFHFLHLLDNF